MIDDLDDEAMVTQEDLFVADVEQVQRVMREIVGDYEARRPSIRAADVVAAGRLLLDIGWTRTGAEWAGQIGSRVGKPV